LIVVLISLVPVPSRFNSTPTLVSFVLRFKRAVLILA
jgi:hypothetical protein